MHKSRPTVDSARSLDVRRIVRDARGATSGVIYWAGGMSIAFSLDPRSARLVLTLGGHAMAEHVSLTSTPCHYGGIRWWASCPGCARRIAILYLGDAGFRCRHCYGLAYRVTREGKLERLTRRARRFRRRLRGSDCLLVPFPWKPPLMWWRTYWRIASEGQAADLAALDATLAKLERLTPWRAGRSRPTPSPSSAR